MKKFPLLLSTECSKKHLSSPVGNYSELLSSQLFIFKYKILILSLEEKKISWHLFRSSFKNVRYFYQFKKLV